MSVLSFYDQWPQYNRRMVDVVGAMSDAQLKLHPVTEWPIWATVGHTAGGRVYWLCHVVGEPGADGTPFGDPAGLGWEDDLDTPRNATELVWALESTFAVVEDCLNRWVPEMLGAEVTREYGGVRRSHTRGSILQRLLSHDAYHCGELSQALGVAGLPQIDLWRSE
jgi:uncharacterized damage-inducible protein DinB